MQKAVNYLRGTVRLEVTGPYPERFFNICSAWSVPFWGVEQVDGVTVRVTVPRSRLSRVKKLAPRCLCQITPVSEAGAPGLLLGFRRRYGMLVGLMLSLLAVLVFSRFVLVIDIEGETTLSHREILSHLAQCGLYPGAYGPSLNPRAISNQMLLEVEGLGFLSVNLHGIRAQVVVRDSQPAPELEQERQPTDLVAKKDGQVLAILPVSGDVLVAQEEQVRRGQTLIAGQTTVVGKEGEVMKRYSVRARGLVLAQVEEEFSAAIPLKYVEKQYTGRQREYTEWVIFGKRFKISSKSFQEYTYYDKISNTQSITLGSVTLPIARTTVQCKEFSLVSGELPAEQGEAALRSALTGRLEQSIGTGGRILQTHWHKEQEDGVLTLTLSAQCREQIAVERTQE